MQFFTVVLLGRDHIFLFLSLFPVWSMIHLFFPPSYASLISVRFLIGIMGGKSNGITKRRWENYLNSDVIGLFVKWEIRMKVAVLALGLVASSRTW